MPSSRIAELRPERRPCTDSISVTIPLAGRILVVHGSAAQRTKLAEAVRHLGHGAQVAPDGEQALVMLVDGDYDLVLLDLAMPGVDGFAVLESIGANASLRDVPVIVVSTLGDTDSTVRALALGAVDHLPDAYDAALLNVRINTSLDRKWQRDRELEYRRRTRALTDAAEKLSCGQLDPARLGLAPLSRCDDALGTLAQVFEGMVGRNFARERQRRQRLHTLRNVLLLLIAGIVLGAAMPLSRLASELQPHPFGVALWVSVITAVLGLGSAAARGRLPRMTPALVHLSLAWGALNAIAFVLIFWVAQYLTGTALSIVIVCEGFIVFVIAALARVEPVSLKRLAGVATGFFGIVSLILTSGDSTLGGGSVWLVVALLVPLNFAFEDLLVAARMPSGVDVGAMVGLSMLVSALLLLVPAWLLGDLVPLTLAAGAFELIVLLLALKSLVGMVLFTVLMTSAGALFGSQLGYVKALSGIVWSMLVLNESMSPFAWLSFAIILCGLFLVESRKVAEGDTPEDEVADDEPGLPSGAEGLARKWSAAARVRWWRNRRGGGAGYSVAGGPARCRHPAPELVDCNVSNTDVIHGGSSRSQRSLPFASRQDVHPCPTIRIDTPAIQNDLLPSNGGTGAQAVLDRSVRLPGVGTRPSLGSARVQDGGTRASACCSSARPETEGERQYR